MPLTLEQVKNIQKKFLETDVMDYANGVGICGATTKDELALSVMFPSNKEMDAWPNKDSHFENVELVRKVVGVIRAL